MPLVPCPHCHRHVVVSETACPFCAAPLALVAPRGSSVGFLGRAAVFAVGVAASACGDNDKPSLPTHDAATAPKDSALDASPVDADVDAGGVAIYSAAPTDASKG